MIYLDTCFLTPLFRAEATSKSVERFLSTQADGSLAVSQWTRVEFASVIAREARMKLLDEKTARRLIDEFDALVDVSLHLWIPKLDDFNLAHQFVSQFESALRAPDALHLAIARNHGAEEVLTFDEGLLFAAKKLKIKARRGIRS